MSATPGKVALACGVWLLAACGSTSDNESRPDSVADYYGTLEPFASEAVYFVMTDRFVDGDPANNYPDQGGPELHTFDRPVTRPDGLSGNIGYLGGDFQGLLDNADYIAEMGFSAVWITPIVENPDEAFTGGLTLEESPFADRGKTGYHGYWGVNFYREDEHLVSPGLDFSVLTRRLEDEHGLKTVLDIVCNHGSPSWTMPEDQPLYGEIYGRNGELLADHMNLQPAALSYDEPLHRFFHHEPDLAMLSNLDDRNPEVLDYMVGAYLQWIDEGAAAFRIDTIRHMPHAFWKQFSDRIRAEHPGFFMFGEHFDYDATKIAEHMRPENGRISVLDFPGKQRMEEVFGDADSDFADILDYLHLADDTYENPYDLMTFYDNHDMPRMAASMGGFIDANNWIFTSRGIPVIYYGSEIGFRAGRAEHAGNRDYFGVDNILVARSHPVRRELITIANLRKSSPALQRGLQVNIEFEGHKAAFLRVYQKDGVHQAALVLLNKGDDPAEFAVDRWLSVGTWRDALSGQQLEIGEPGAGLEAEVGGHGVRVFLFDAPNNDPALERMLTALQD